MNDENTGFAACSLYNAIKLHFTTDSYDFFKYNGKSNITKDQFARRKDKFQFYKLAKKYSYNELIDFLVANFLVRNVKWAGDLLDTESDEVYRKWQKTKQSLMYEFEQDILHLKDLVQDSPSELLKVNRGDYPKLLSEWMHGNIKLETICIMESLLKFTTMWSEKISETIIWPQKKNLILKYVAFLKFDKDRCRDIMKEHLL